MLKLWDPSIIISSLYLYLKQRSLTNVSFCSVEQNVALTILIYLCSFKKNQGKVTVPLMKNLFSVSCDRWLSGLSALKMCEENSCRLRLELWEIWKILNLFIFLVGLECSFMNRKTLLYTRRFSLILNCFYVFSWTIDF